MEAGVSVIICTYNGAALLPETLRHLAAQQVSPEIPWEVLVIDNASTDNSAEVAHSVWENSGKPSSFSVIHEPKAGLSFARKTGLANARYEFVLFCDDDNWLSPDYIEKAFQTMVHHPEIGILGSCGELIYEENPPPWAAGSRLFASGPQAPKPGKVARNLVYGAGCLLRRSAYDALLKAGFHSRLTDRKGSSLSSGGDYELCYAIAMTGYQIWYNSQLTFRHFIPAKRLTQEYHERYFRDNAQSLPALLPYRLLINKGAAHELAFHLHYAKTVASYGLKLIPVFLKYCLNAKKTGSGLANHLAYLALKAKFNNLLLYKTIVRNYREIRIFSRDYHLALHFRQGRLQPYR